MTSPGSNLHMLQMWLDPRHLAALGKMLRLPLRQTNPNYLVHCALGELFQQQAPKPFSLEENNGRLIALLAYSTIDSNALHELAKGFASPSVYRIVDWEHFHSKPMPSVFPEGMGFDFELRTCPVVRKASQGAKWNKGQEIDAFLSAVWEHDGPEKEFKREEVYINWLNSLVEKQEGAILKRVEMERFSIERMSRRTQGSKRSMKVIQRPDVTFKGTIAVRDSDAFKALLQKGIGRHKSFGYGMLKLRRSK